MTELTKDHLLALCRRPNPDVDLFDEIDSTNDWLQTAPGTGVRFCIADSQTQGKGQRGRHWHSPKGQNVYLSCRYPFQNTAQDFSGLSLAVSLTTLAIIQSCLPHISLHIKWPNDILYNNKKLAGILIELKSTPSEMQAIIGIGINVNMPPDSKTPIDQPWTSIQEITQHRTDRNILCAALIEQLPNTLNCFEHQGLSAFLEKWPAVDYLFGKTINVQQNDVLFQGVAAGVDAFGRLIVKNDDAVLMQFVSGEAHVIK